MNEVKHERFRRIVEKRMTGIIKDLKKLGNCAEPASYEYTEREAEQIIAELELQIFHLRERFAGRKRFSLKTRTIQPTTHQITRLPLKLIAGLALL